MTKESFEENGKPLWVPSEDYVRSTSMYEFARNVEGKTGLEFKDYQSLWRWSVGNPEVFWNEVWGFCGITGEKGGVTLKNPEKMEGGQFFPEGRINYAENLLRRRDDAPAIIFRNEKSEERTLSFKELYDEVSRWVQAFSDMGIGKGDRVAGYMPNMPETIIACLAATSLGAVWSSASPDFGVQGVVDRFGQIEPKVMICVDKYFYNGKDIDCLGKVKEIVPRLGSLEKVVVVPFTAEKPDISQIDSAVLSEDFIGDFKAGDIDFTRVEFNHPLFIMFSSGTTGVPKCIVHGHGGTLIQHVKEHRLQCNIKEGDRVFYFTTTGWMMWNWLISALASGATLLLFDGSPFYPDGNMLWDFADKNGCVLFGTSAKYIDVLKTNGMCPKDDFSLDTIRIITSTGSPLVHESFDYVYDSIKKDVHLASIAGGTDIISCFMLGNPISPVWRGELQGPGLGMAVDVFDDTGKPIPAGAGTGELVCTRPFPSMPVMFWNDEGGKRYRSAYFDVYDNVWCHGDWIERTEHGGFIIHGRSDATLNPGGVRIGTAEIYRQVEQIPEVVESIAVGQNWENDVRVVLFVVLKNGIVLDDELIKKIKTVVRTGASPRHMPAVVIQVSDIPRTKSGKITEIAVRDVIHGREVKNKEALANPEALELYKNLPELQ